MSDFYEVLQGCLRSDEGDFGTDDQADIEIHTP